MSIERMQNIALLVPASSRDRFVEWLYDQREVHLEEFRETPDTWCERFCSLEGDPSGIELRISRLQGAVDFLREAHKRPADFVEGLFPVKMLATPKELEDAVAAVDVDRLAAECARLQDAIERARESRERMQSERDRLHEIDFLKVPIGRLRELRSLSLHLVAATGQGQKAFASDSRLGEDIHVETVSGFGNAVIYAMVAPKAAEERMQEIINDYGILAIDISY
jgi:vacuolar-type H+-ATPase subunit I/STV1